MRHLAHISLPLGDGWIDAEVRITPGSRGGGNSWDGYYPPDPPEVEILEWSLDTIPQDGEMPDAIYDAIYERACAQDCDT